MNLLTGILGALGLILFGLYRIEAARRARAEKALLIERDDRAFMLGQEKLSQLKLKLDEIKEKHEEASERYRSATDSSNPTQDRPWRPGDPGGPTE